MEYIMIGTIIGIVLIIGITIWAVAGWLYNKIEVRNLSEQFKAETMAKHGNTHKPKPRPRPPKKGTKK